MTEAAPVNLMTSWGSTLSVFVYFCWTPVSAAAPLEQTPKRIYAVSPTPPVVPRKHRRSTRPLRRRRWRRWKLWRRGDQFLCQRRFAVNDATGPQFASVEHFRLKASKARPGAVSDRNWGPLATFRIAPIVVCPAHAERIAATSVEPAPRQIGEPECRNLNPPTTRCSPRTATQAGTPASCPTAATSTRRTCFVNQPTCTVPAASRTPTHASANRPAPATRA